MDIGQNSCMRTNIYPSSSMQPYFNPDYIIIIYFPENKLSIQCSKSSLVLSSTGCVGLGASWLFRFSLRFFLIWKSSSYNTVIAFCLYTSDENRCSYWTFSLMSSADLTFSDKALHLRICCWSSSDSVHNVHNRLLLAYFCS